MNLGDTLKEIIEAITLDAASSSPGLFTLATVVHRLAFTAYDGRGQGGSITQAQKRAAKQWLDTHCERKIINGKVWYSMR